MALIECSECGKKISSKAKECPSCGNPIAATTVEQTGKKWKGSQLIGVIILIIGAIWLIVKLGAGEDALTAAIFTAVGLFLYVFSRLMAWWHHA